MISRQLPVRCTFFLAEKAQVAPRSRRRFLDALPQSAPLRCRPAWVKTAQQRSYMISLVEQNFRSLHSTRCVLMRHHLPLWPTRHRQSSHQAKTFGTFTTDIEDITLKQSASRAKLSRHSFPPRKLDVYISCQPGLEKILSTELHALKLPHAIHDNGARLESDFLTFEQILQCHLYLGTASHIWLRCNAQSLHVRALGELQRKVSELPWTVLLQPHVRFKVKVTAAKSRLLHSTAIRDRVLAGIDDALGRTNSQEASNSGIRGSNDSSGEQHQDSNAYSRSKNESKVLLWVQIVRDKLHLSIAGQVEPLHRRGYRLETAKAPLREDLAYAMLCSAGWTPSWWNDQVVYDALLDPFCGAGTIALEAAAMSMHMPPGRLLPVPFFGTHLYRPKVWTALVEGAKKEAQSRSALVSCSDRDAGAVRATKTNADRAGVDVDVQQCAFSSHPWLNGPSVTPQCLLIASNLPFGRRLGKAARKDLLPMYQTLLACHDALLNHGKEVSMLVLTDDETLVQRSAGMVKNSVLHTSHGGINVVAILLLHGKPVQLSKRVDTETAGKKLM